MENCSFRLYEGNPPECHIYDVLGNDTPGLHDIYTNYDNLLQAYYNHHIVQQNNLRWPKNIFQNAIHISFTDDNSAIIPNNIPNMNELTIFTFADIILENHQIISIDNDSDDWIYCPILNPSYLHKFVLYDDYNRHNSVTNDIVIINTTPAFITFNNMKRTYFAKKIFNKLLLQHSKINTINHICILLTGAQLDFNIRQRIVKFMY